MKSMKIFVEGTEETRFTKSLKVSKSGRVKMKMPPVSDRTRSELFESTKNAGIFLLYFLKLQFFWNPQD